MTLAAEKAGRLDPSRPWPGLDPFPEEASAFFYGRDQECDEMFRYIRRDMTTLLFGQSGLGKTSLLQAGLFPLLRRNGFLPIRIRLDYATAAIAPAAQMVATLEQALAGAKLSGYTLVDPDQPLWAYFHQSDLHLVAPNGTIVTPVLVFDQFEEAFTLGLAREGMRGRTQKFLSELTDLIENRPTEELETQFARSPHLVEHYVFDRQPYRIVIALREDYLAALESMRERAPSLGRSRFRLTAMNGRQALEAVIKPGRAVVSREVAIEIIRFISQARREDPFGAAANEGAIETLEIEPSLLSLFCHELNERRLKNGAREITHDLVVGSSQSVLEEFYEAALRDQPPALRSFIEEELITKSGFRESMALERAREELRQRGIAPEALEVLVRRRILRVEERLQVSRVEIIHDLLIEVIRRSRANREQRYLSGVLAGSWLDKNPFRGLEPYRFEDSQIFFGRAEATRNTVDRLIKNAESGCPFLLILGADGVGKTSLVQAGVMPTLIQSEVLGAGLWRQAIMRPGARLDDPIRALVEALVANDALPELAASAPGPGTLATLFAGGPAEAALLLVDALQKRETEARQRDELPAYGVARLVVVVDQLEELFVGLIRGEQRARFVDCLQAFVASGRIFVIAALRSAFWHRATELPQLVKLSDGWGRMDLLPPSPAELAEIIRKPAQAAGLLFEVHATTGIGLDAVIAQEAEAAPGVLPLLSFVLYSLYDLAVGRRGDRLLTYAAYETIGGVTGALAMRAEECVASLPPEALGALPHVLRAMTTVGDDTGRLIARAVSIDMFPLGTSARMIVDKMIADRLLVTSIEGMAPTVRPAHDALLTHWDRARQLLDEHRRDFETRSRIEQARNRWAEAGRAPSLLLRDPDLANAVALVRRSGGELDPSAISFVTASRRRTRRGLVFITTAAAVFALMAVAATAAGTVAMRQRMIAEAQRTAAQRSFQLALTSIVNLLQQVQDNLGNGRLSVAVATEMLTKAENTLEGLDQTGSTPELTKSQIQLYLTLSDTQEAMGDFKTALSTLISAKLLTERLAGGDSETQRVLVSVLTRIGDVLEVQGNLMQALAHYDAARQIAEAAARADPSDAAAQRQLSLLYSKLADASRARGDLTTALAAYHMALEISQRLASSDPGAQELRLDLAIMLLKTGDVLQAQARFEDALLSYRRGIEIERQLAASEPQNVVLQRDLASALNRIGEVQTAQGNLDDALSSYRQELEIRRSLAEKDPDNAQWQSDLSVSYNKIGDVQVDQGNLPAALASFQTSLAILDHLAKSDPGNASWQRALSLSLNNTGDVQKTQGDFAGALKSYRDSLAISERLTKSDAGNAQWQRDLSVSYNNIGDVLMAQGSLEDALMSYRSAVAILQPAVERDKNNADWRKGLEYSISQIGGLAYRYVLARNFTTALQTADQAISLAPDEISLYTNRAHALMFLNRTDEARALYLKYRGQKDVQDGKSWEAVIIEDFGAFRKAGLTNPLMDEMEKLFTSAR